MIFTIVDIETTGLNRELDEILEVGYMQINGDLEILRSGNLYFYKPEYNVESDAQKIHKITREFLEQYEDKFMENTVKLYTLLENSIIIGKNSDYYDIPVLKNFFRKHAPEIAPLSIQGTLDMQKVYVDRFRAYYLKRMGIPTRKKGKLGELIEMIGYSDAEVMKMYLKDIPENDGRSGAHSALYDVYMTYLLVKDAVETDMIELVNKTGKSREELTYERLVADIDKLIELPVSLHDKFLNCLCDLHAKYGLDDMFFSTVRGYQYRYLITDWQYRNDFRDNVIEGNSDNGIIYQWRTSVIFDIRYFAVWMMEAFMRTNDIAFIKLARALYCYKGLIKEEDYNKDKTLAFNCDITEYGENVTTLYLNYIQNNVDHFGGKSYIDPNDKATIDLFVANQSEFWKKAIPSSVMIIRDVLNGRIVWSSKSIFGATMLMTKRGDIQQ